MTPRDDTTLHEIYALRYASRGDALRRDSFMFQQADDRPMPEDYFVWLIRGPYGSILVDTGFDDATGAKRSRTTERRPREALGLLGVRPDDISHCVLTHLHHDHAGTLDDFPKATFHVQELEMAFASGPMMRFQHFRRSYEVEHVARLLRCVFDGRVAFHHGDGEIVPGVSVHLIGGHTAGLQCVRVATQRGFVVLASDSMLFYEHHEKLLCHPTVYEPRKMLEGYGRLSRLASSVDHLIPGHDPAVMSRYPAPSPALEGIVARLDVAPIR